MTGPNRLLRGGTGGGALGRLRGRKRGPAGPPLPEVEERLLDWLEAHWPDRMPSWDDFEALKHLPDRHELLLLEVGRRRGRRDVVESLRALREHHLAQEKTQ